MRITKTQAYQGHPVPGHVYYPSDDLPLDHGILEEPGVSENEDESGEWSNHVESVSEPDYEPAKKYRCKHCRAIVNEFELDDHECGE